MLDAFFPKQYQPWVFAVRAEEIERGRHAQGCTPRMNWHTSFGCLTSLAVKGNGWRRVAMVRIATEPLRCLNSN
jgi:hypothetical protein